jgi:hypothetical protein
MQGDDDHCAEAEADAQASKPHKITICHIPPGNPDNAHTINVSKNAKRAHLAHGDVLGGCGCSGDGPSGGDGGPTPTTTDTPDDGDRPPVTTTPGGDDSGSGDDADGSGNDDTPSTTQEPDPSGSTTPTGDPGGASQLCDSDQTLCDSLADCGDNQTCDATSGCCVDVYL